MAGDVPSGVGEGQTAQPPTGNWPPPFVGQSALRPRPWLVIAVAATAAVAIAALIVALTRSTTLDTSTKTMAPTYTAAEISRAERQLCDTYKLAARSVEVETNGTDKALARIALSNAAGMIDDAARDPAIEAKNRDTARALAAAYRTSNALGSVATDTEYRTALDSIVAKDAAMRQACSDGGG